MGQTENNIEGLRRKPAANTRLASCGVTCLHSSSVFQLGFSAGLTVLCSEIPHERQAVGRWQSYALETKKNKNPVLGTFFIIFEKK